MTVQAVRIQFITDYQRRGIQAYQRDLAQVGNSSQAAATKVGTSMGKIAAASRFAGTALMVGVGAALAVGIKASVDFEDAFAGVRKTVDASEPEFQRLADAIIRLSTEIPVSAKELAGIGELGGQLGIPVENLEDFIEVIAKLGVATNLSLDDAATSLARFANVMGSSEDDFDNIASSLVELGNNAAAQEDEILRFATRLAGIGATVGATEGDVLGLAAAFTELGVAPERGATAVQRAFVAMLEGVQQGNEELSIFAETAGLTREEFTELFNLDPVEAFLAFVEGLARVNHEGGQTTAILDSVGLGSQRTLSALLKAANGFDIVREQVERGNDAFAENNALNEEAEKRFETIISQLGLMKNAATAWVMSLGGGLLPTLKDVIQTLTAFFEVLAENEAVVNAFILAVIALGVGRAFRAILKFGGALDVLSVFRMPKFIGGMDAANTRARTFSDTMRFAWTRIGGFSGALTLATLALGGIALAMAIQKKRAKEAQAALGRLTDTVESFEDGAASAQDVYEDFIEALRAPRGIFDLTVDLEDIDLRKALVETGVTPDLLVDLAINDPDEFERVAAETIGQVEQELRDLGEGEMPGLFDTGMFAPDEADEVRLRLERVRFAIKEIREQAVLLREEEALRARERRVQTSKELEEWHRLEMARAHGLLTPGGFDIPEFIPGFRGTVEEYEEILADLRGETKDFGQDFVDDWFDIVDDIQEALLDFDTAFDEFETTTEFNLSALSESLSNWVTEQAQITEALRLVVEEFGAEAGAFFLTLDPAIQGQFGAALAAGEGEAFLETFGGILDEREGLLQQAFERALLIAPVTAGRVTAQWENFMNNELIPTLAEEGIEPGTEAFNIAISEMFTEAFTSISEQSPIMGGEIRNMLEQAAREALMGLDMTEIGKVEEIMRSELTTADKIKAFADMGLSWSAATALGFSNLPDMIDDIKEFILFQGADPADIKFLNAGKRWAAKAAEGFNDLPRLIRGITEDAAEDAINAADKKFLNQSPSKVFQRIGKDVAMGFDLGLEAGGALAAFKPHQPIVNVQTPPSSVSRDLNITIDHPEHRDDDILSSLQETTTLVALTRFAETTPGNN